MQLTEYDKAYKSVSKLKAILSFFFSKSNFLRLSVKHDIGLNLSNDHQRRKYFRGVYKPNEKEGEALASKRLSQLRSSLLNSFILVTITAFLAVYLGSLLSVAFGPLPPVFARVLQVGCAALLLWATLWELGWGLRSWVGETLPERVHRWIFRGFFILGSFCFFLSVTW